MIITPFTVVHYGAVLITPPDTEITAVPLILGLIAVFISGTFIGNIISIILRLTGIDYLYFKCLGSLFVLWIVHVSILPRVIAPELFRVLPIITIIVNFLIKIIWAITYAYLYSTITKLSSKFN
jgi:hypothetical protein